jgi:hypothetical protein
MGAKPVRNVPRRCAEVVSMDVRAIVLLGGSVDKDAEHIAGVPIALLDLLGRSVLHRTIDDLRKCGVTQVAVIGDPGSALSSLRSQKLLATLKATPGAAPWRAAQHTFAEYAQSGADVVFVLRLGAYLELDYESVIQFHLDQHSRVTAVCNSSGELLDYFAISGSRRNDAAFLLRHRLRAFRAGSTRFPYSGYRNPLSSAGDFRRLAVEALAGRVQIRPDGHEIRPGVWLGRGARIHPRARVLAPAFIGSQTRINASAVVTRCGVVEHHAVIDCSTVVEDATVLPYTVVGAGLDVSHSVVGFRRINHLHRGVEIQIADPKLLDTVASAPVRFLGGMASLASFFPVHFVRGLLRGGRRISEADLPTAVSSPSPALKFPADPGAPDRSPDQFAGRLAIARSRYEHE